MVYGNMGGTSGTGVCFTRNPANGARELFGKFLINAQVARVHARGGGGGGPAGWVGGATSPGGREAHEGG